MKKQILFSVSIILLLAGCKKAEPIAPGEPVKTETQKECYSYEKDGTLISLQMEVTGESVMGAMVYALAEKDKNAGLLGGTLKDSILIADYTFESEGTTSVRQVAFKLENGQLLEGYGDMNEDGTKFKDISKLKFDSKMPLSKRDCPQ